MNREDVLTIAKALYEERGDPSDIRTTRINERLGGDKTTDFLRRRYGDRRTEIEAEYNLTPPYIALLREEVTGRIPFLEERKVWRNFQPSKSDWLRYVRLPTIITPAVAELLGIYYFNSSASIRETKDGHHQYYLNMCGRNENLQFYQEFVAPRIRDVHNLEVKIKPEESTLDGKHYPEIVLGSHAIVTWWLSDVDLPKIPKLPIYLQSFFFDAGFAVSARPVNGNMRIYANPEKVNELFNLVQVLGFSVRKSRDYLMFIPEDVRRIHLLNPYHRNLSL